MTYTVWKLGEMVGNFATRDGALAYVRGHVGRLRGLRDHGRIR
jgi:hypothetical protein